MGAHFHLQGVPGLSRSVGSRLKLLRVAWLRRLLDVAQGAERAANVLGDQTLRANALGT